MTDKMTATITQTEDILDITPHDGDTWISVEATLDAFKEEGWKIVNCSAVKKGDKIEISIILRA